MTLHHSHDQAAQLNVTPFADFIPPAPELGDLRKAIADNYRRPEAECVPILLDQATLPPEMQTKISDTASTLIHASRAKHKGHGITALMREYSLSSREGISLMCLAEALLRVPDKATRDALIEDKIAGRRWKSHLGSERSMFVNAATWGLLVTGTLTAAARDGQGLRATLARLVKRLGGATVRRAVQTTIQLIGEQFVTGQTIEEAINQAIPRESAGFLFSYDMLGEAAVTADDATRYYKEYEAAIHAIGKAAGGRGLYAGPGISIKLSALHARYSKAQSARVLDELLPKLKALAVISRSYDIGLNIDAEEADRLELSLDLLESLCFDPQLAGWNGLGFVVQAYGKRAPYVIDFLIDLARRSGHRLMVRLVKGAYWDTEIKRAQVDGLNGFPVYTRKAYTDIAYIACARKLLAAADLIFPQFATHNAQTLATVCHLAGDSFKIGQYEFQCLHGMGEQLYSEVISPHGLNRPCRIYAPVGTHETLLAYLVRRMLENGANSSFVNKISDSRISVSELAADPADLVRAMPRMTPHEAVLLPSDLFGPERRNSLGIDLSDDNALLALSRELQAAARQDWIARPQLADNLGDSEIRQVHNPANALDVVGQVADLAVDSAAQVVDLALGYTATWAAADPGVRAAALDKAATMMQDRMGTFISLLIREAGKSAANAVGEVREAIDFLRYYADQARATLTSATEPLGPIVCISPWNFPLAIFTGQIAAALVTGNPVVAKPAETTPLVAAECVRILHAAGIPRGVLQFVPGDGRIGAALVAAPATAGVMFTGSTEVARLIQAQLAARLSPRNRPIPLIAETGGLNGMIVDSSALPEQVVADVIASAFDSAGQRCSALRVLCLQDEIADRILKLLRGALRELSVGQPNRLATDIGPIITAGAKSEIERHISEMRERGFHVEQVKLGDDTRWGSFVPPTIIELSRFSDLAGEVFGPVLHVVRFKRDEIDRLVDEINEAGYGLTFGIHTRIDNTIDQLTGRIKAGNIYVNRNMIGAVVGVQPFGGRGFSGTGPKAGGPLYLGRLVVSDPRPFRRLHSSPDPVALAFAEWLAVNGSEAEAAAVRDIASRSHLGMEMELPGPAGERNSYKLCPRGTVLLVPQTRHGLICQIAAGLACGNSLVIDAPPLLAAHFANLPEDVAARFTWSGNWAARGPLAAALIEGKPEQVRAALRAISQLPGPLVPVQAASPAEIIGDPVVYRLDWLLEEVTVSTNTAAAGGNASLLSIV